MQIFKAGDDIVSAYRVLPCFLSAVLARQNSVLQHPRAFAFAEMQNFRRLFDCNVFGVCLPDDVTIHSRHPLLRDNGGRYRRYARP